MQGHDTGTDGMAGRLQDLRARLAAACYAAGREPEEVVLLPVSKTFPAEAVREAWQLGLRRFGENRTQEIRDKAPALADCDLQWVVIGHLQTNKAKDAVRLASEVQSLDRMELAHELDRRLQAAGRSMDVLVQIKTSHEESKHGLDGSQLEGFLRQVARDCASLRVRGLMTVAVNAPEPDPVRACFRQLRQYRDQMRELAIEGVGMQRLSMGMSGDFALAIAEGSTEVRIGSALFGARQYGPA